MKKGIHPQYHKNAKVVVDGQTVLNVGSTKPELHVEIWAGTHPFYTGQQRFVDTASRIEKFEARKTKVQTSKKPKKTQTSNKESESTAPLTLKDMLQSLKKK